MLQVGAGLQRWIFWYELQLSAFAFDSDFDYFMC